MPDPDRLLNTIARAIDHVRSTPGRSGRVLEPAGVKDVLVVGDLHGQVGHLQTILRMADLADRPDRHLVLQEMIHGPFTYPDGSDKSHQMVDLFCALKCQYPDRVHYLMGNHEMSQWTGQRISKGDAEQNQGFAEGVECAYLGRGREVYEAYLRLFAELPLAIRYPNGVWLTHSIPSMRKHPSFSLAPLRQDPPGADQFAIGGYAHALVWGRDVSAANVEAFAHALSDRDGSGLFVTGHLPCERGFASPNRRQLVLDCSQSPGGVCLFPADEMVTLEELLAGARTI